MKKNFSTQQSKNELALILFRLTHFYCKTQDNNTFKNKNQLLF